MNTDKGRSNIYPCRQALAESLERWLESMEVL